MIVTLVVVVFVALVVTLIVVVLMLAIVVVCLISVFLLILAILVVLAIIYLIVLHLLLFLRLFTILILKRFFLLARSVLYNFLRALIDSRPSFVVWFHRTIGATTEITRFIIKYVILILWECLRLSVINDVITYTLDLCKILVNLLLRQFLRVPLLKVRVVEVLVLALIMDNF